jgi:SAM-dependent methyltransferase
MTMPGMSTGTDSVEMRREPIPLRSTGSCWICGAEDWKRVWADPFDLSDKPPMAPYNHGEHPPSWVVRCRACGFGQPEALPALPDYFEKLYHWPRTPEQLDREFENPYRDFIYRTILSELDRRRGPNVPRSLLDIGASIGRFVDLARQAGWNAEGAELDPVTASYAAKHRQLPVHHRAAQELADEGRRFGALTFNDVLEHIPQPLPLLKEVRELLVPGGLLAIKVPHGPMQRIKERFKRDLLGQRDWQRSRTGIMIHYSHVNHFTVRSLRICLEQAGYRVLAIVAGAPEYVPISKAAGRLNPLAVALLRRSVYAAARWVPGGVHSPLAMNLQAYAVRPGIGDE